VEAKEGSLLLKLLQTGEEAKHLTILSLIGQI
jgi:hypothetical protein